MSATTHLTATITRNTPLAASLALAILLSYISGCSTASSARNREGLRNYQVGNYQQAIQSFQQTLAADPHDANAYYNLAATYYAMGKQRGDEALLKQAEGLYHQCLDHSPDHNDCYRGLAALLVDTNRSESAFTLLKGWTERSPQATNPRIELARLYEEFGDRDTARRHLTDAIHIDQRNPRAWAALASVREQDGQLAQAMADYQQAYQLNQLQPGLAQRMASLQQRIAMAGPTAGNTTQR